MRLPHDEKIKNLRVKVIKAVVSILNSSTEGNQEKH